MLTVRSIDHVVLTCRNMAATLRFYTEVLGLSEVTFGQGRRKALAFGEQKINLHAAGQRAQGVESVVAVAAAPTPGSLDLCFVVAERIELVAAHLAASGIPIEEGPVTRTGAKGPIRSVYVRDPDGNLIELASYAA